ncbi:elongated Cy07 [Cynomolgus cytomegalovirus]|uniref:Uncharacterized protein n=1 Tax=Cynomolgus macaque cytomegalovirus strain Mauritius TaxID=1690255 RepID=A0A0K1GZW6_9BETA|nr:elongated Cy07 [Cynomolgus cytomegalovirus]AKT72762.1 hypothetical protein [Cynomolgus macaque cytomegalovirus strain Mauritius]AXG21708.1 hypothetical protein [synthetic construct]APT39229.1 elongated Cy07 [Cynomolgus cytomegalovirus]APT39402.1 elongated Cy07 [Cynomolgus cytomegalovirus]APT39575.1 elongated Cy07 [Cynomolgus cytomegalovirus]
MNTGIKHYSSYVCYSIIFMFRDSSCSEDIFYNYSAVTGGSVTFFDVTGLNGFAKGTWYFLPANDSCYRTLLTNDALAKLCSIYYHIELADLITTTSSCPTYFNHTCNITSLSLYNISDKAPTSYKLVKNTDRGIKNVTYYNLHIVLLDNEFPSQQAHLTRPRDSPYNTPIIVIVVLLIVIIAIVYMQYSHKEQNSGNKRHELIHFEI